MKTIFLIRHANQYKEIIYEKSRLNDYNKNLLIPLSCEGEENAKLMTYKYFCNNINHLYSSEYSRAINTAKYISESNNIPINICSDFNERKLGNTNGVNEDFWLEQLKNEDVKTIDGESQKEVRDRMLNGLLKVLENTNDNESVVIVSHATAITFLLMNWCDLISASLEGKKRHLKYKNKTIMNGTFKTPEVFKLTFLPNNQIIDIEIITKGGD